MAKVKITGHATGTGIITIAAPNTNTNRTLTLPDADVTLGIDDTTNREGTAIISTGESGGTKFLREDGDGTCSWQAAGGSSGVHTLLSTTKITSNTASIDITSIDAKYKIILVKYALRGATNMSSAKLVLGVNGTWTTGSDYTSGSNSIASMQLDGGWARQQGAGHFEIFNLGDSTARTAIFSKHMEMTDAYTSTTLLTPAVNKYATRNTTAYNSFKISGTYGGNYTSGFVNVYGIADS